MSLWKQVKTIKKESSNESTEDTNLPFKGANYLVSVNENLVDVVNDYRWTISPKSSRGDVPYAHLIEKRVTNNILLQQAVYHIKALKEWGNVSVDTYTKLLQTASGLNDDNLSEIVEEAKNNTIKNKDTDQIDEDARENPYKGLYSLEDTGWQYVFPYFDTTNKSINGKWVDGASRGKVGEISNQIIGAIEDTSNIFGVVSAALGAGTGLTQAPVGTYIEKPKQYEYGQTQETYNIVFKLYNTFDYVDIIKNWEFCFLLIYQNLPNRRTKAIIDPPSLYEFFIPGIKHCPLAYIQSLKIEFVGATRVMNLIVGDNSKQIEAIVPDAYKITLQLTDIFPESRNFMAGILDETKRITVSDSNSVFQKKNSEFLFNMSGSEEENLTNFNKIGNTVSDAANSVKRAVSGIFSMGIGG